MNSEKEINKKIREYADRFEVDEAVKDRIPKPHFEFIGEDIWNQAAVTLLSKKNLLLVGEKSTGKNVLAENLAYAFRRPLWDISLNINIDASALIGSDTLKTGEVVFQPGPIYNCAKFGGFGILDEINMAKNEALAVLHSTLDFRRSIDVPGYERIELNEATRFIATMNYGYAGTRELNEALLSRFVVIEMPVLKEEGLVELMKQEFSDIKDSMALQFAALFTDIRKKAQAGEISESALDLRGLVDALALIKNGLRLNESLNMTIVNKCFDSFERNIISDCIKARFKDSIGGSEIFEE